MFVATPGNQVLAIDAKAGNLLWRYKRPAGAFRSHENIYGTLSRHRQREGSRDLAGVAFVLIAQRVVFGGDYEDGRRVHSSEPSSACAPPGFPQVRIVCQQIRGAFRSQFCGPQSLTQPLSRSRTAFASQSGSNDLYRDVSVAGRDAGARVLRRRFRHRLRADPGWRGSRARIAARDHWQRAAVRALHRIRPAVRWRSPSRTIATARRRSAPSGPA